jgi:RNA-directed DNA polymerase
MGRGPAKATSRTADMYVPEKSDCAVLPVNQPNKGGQLSAEAGEGRAQTRENIAQSHMHPTQSGKRMSQGLDGVRKAAKERKQERFSKLPGATTCLAPAWEYNCLAANWIRVLVDQSDL